MKRKKITFQRKTRVRRERDPIPWKYCVLTVVCGLILVGGFFFAARLHFSAIEYGFKNANLRKQVEHLKTENRLAILRREMALSGVNKVARKIGFERRTANNIEIVGAPAEKFPVVMAAAREERSEHASTSSETVATNLRIKLGENEKKITRTVINKPKRNDNDKRSPVRTENKSELRE